MWRAGDSVDSQFSSSACLFGDLDLGSQGGGKCLYLLGHLAALSPSVLIKGAIGWFLGYL